MPRPIVNKATAVWNGDLLSGNGTATLDTSGAGSFAANWKARSEESGGTTTPEELIAAAHATCFCMQFSHELAENGTPPTQLTASAEVTFEGAAGIPGLLLDVTGQVDGISAEDFARIAESAKGNCPVSQALKPEVTLSAALA